MLDEHVRDTMMLRSNAMWQLRTLQAVEWLD